jgi:hypothetical protein
MLTVSIITVILWITIGIILTAILIFTFNKKFNLHFNQIDFFTIFVIGSMLGPIASFFYFFTWNDTD